jgi:hypothetical protein
MHSLANFQVFSHVRDTNVHMSFPLECVSLLRSGRRCRVCYSCDSAVIPFPAPGVRVRQYRASRLGSFRAVPHKYSWMVWEAGLDEVR